MIYDLWVTHFSSRYVWRCSAEIHRDHYRKWIGKGHLEVGVGTGYYLSGATLREVQHVAPLDPTRQAPCLHPRRAKLLTTALRSFLLYARYLGKGPDCDLDQSSTFCSQRLMPTGFDGISRAKPWAS